MIEQLVTRFETARLELRQRDLRRQEEAAIARLGEKVLADAGARGGRVASLAAEATAVQGRLRAIATGNGTSPSGASRRRLEELEQKLRQIRLTAGRLALAMPPTGAESEVLAIRAELADTAGEQDRLRGEGRRLADETWTQVRAWVAPRAPALAAVAVTWLIAHGYAGSHTDGILTSLGLSARRRGTHLVSLPVDTALVRYALPLLVASVSGFLAHHLAGRVRTALEDVRSRSHHAPRAAGAPRVAGESSRRVPEKSR
jgi:hypothetical protein